MIAPDATAAVHSIIASYLSNIEALRAVAPEFNWSNPVGDYGEYIAIAKFGLTRQNGAGHDAVNRDGQTVQVKTCRNSTQIGFRGSADLLLVLSVSKTGDWDVVYYGPFAPVAAAGKYSARDNKHVVSLNLLRRLADQPQ